MADETPKLDLVAFDVDGTLVREPRGYTVWEVLNERFTGRADRNRERYARYLRGELSYAEWVALDIEGWRDAGARRDDLVASFAPLALIDGAREALQTLRDSGLQLVVISGTLDLMFDTLLPDHPFDEVHCNHIGFDADGCISHWQATPFDMAGKAQLLRGIAMRRGIALARCGFVGDSSNDVWVARAAGFSVALNPRSEELERLADVVVRSEDLRDVVPHLVAELPPPGPQVSAGQG